MTSEVMGNWVWPRYREGSSVARLVFEWPVGQLGTPLPKKQKQENTTSLYKINGIQSTKNCFSFPQFLFSHGKRTGGTGQPCHAMPGPAFGGRYATAGAAGAQDVRAHGLGARGSGGSGRPGVVGSSTSLYKGSPLFLGGVGLWEANFCINFCDTFGNPPLFVGGWSLGFGFFVVSQKWIPFPTALG